ncbi:MFS transporter [Streptomyces sp. TS71-3]|uniref:MFS transporter n=1 Tax=Streptomyces sp. TS71-3 TaxID=2733862 RepID=UPI001B1901BA|nr:MFS transporter [Streptomyces sp. TS71-3]GHJ41494.1 MFS transporter [Streptomyces sp. TS71-3]
MPRSAVNRGREGGGREGGGRDGGGREGGALSREAVFSTYLPAFVLSLGAGVAVPAVPTLAKSFDVGFGSASGVVTSFVLGNLAGTVPSGWLIDRFGRRAVLLGGPVLTALMAFAVVFTHSFTTLLVLRFFDGVAAQMWLMARLAAISHGTAAGRRGREVSWLFGMNNSGKLAGPLVGGFLASGGGARAPFVVYGVLALAALVPAYLYAEDTPRRKRDPGRRLRRERLAALRGLVLPRLVYFGVALFAGLTRGPVQADLLHLYAAFAYHLGPAEIGYLSTAAAAITLPVGFVSGWLMDRYGRKRTMVPGFTGVALAMCALAASALFRFSVFWYVALFLVGVAAQALTGGSIQTIGADVAPAEGRGMFLGLWRFTGQGGQTLSPFLFAVLAAQFGYASSFAFTAASAAVVAFLLIRYVPETRTAAPHRGETGTLRSSAETGGKASEAG